MKKLLLVSLCVLALCVTKVFAQNRTITGTVTAQDDGLPIPGVTVKIKGTEIGVPTDASGKYSISAPGGAVLTFSFVAFVTQEIPVGDRAVVNVVLVPNNQQLSEVVVTALGISRESKSLGYSVANVKGSEITKARETNIVQSLAGKVAGVNVTQASGTVGGGSKIVIRGATSLAADIQPLFVIDGLIIDNSSQQLATTNSAVPQGTAGVDFGNRAGDINSDDIESINILKGAAAAALYGTLAKNGAIIITTKRGKRGDNGTVEFSSSTRFDSPLVLPKFQNEYAQGNQGLYNIANTNGWGPKISEVQGRTFPNFLGQNVGLQAYPNNIKDFYKTGNTYINSVALSGGNEQGDYRFGYTSNIQTGIIEQERLVRNAVSFNAGRTILPNLTVRTSVNYVRTVTNGLPFQSSNNSNVLTTTIYTLPRTVDINLLRDNYLNATGQQNTLTPARNGNNPYWLLYNNKTGATNNRLYGTVNLSYKVAPWLTLSDNIGTDIYYEYRRSITRIGTIGALTGNFFTGNIYQRIMNNDFLATFTHKIGSDLDLKFIAGTSIYENYYQREQIDAQGLTVDNLYTYTNATTNTPTNTSNKRRIQGVYGNLSVGYKDYLFVELSGRNDWSSTLPKNNNSYFYPAASLGFVFSQLIPNKPSWFSYGKLRASYANVGGDTDPYRVDFVYGPQSNVFAQYSAGSTFPFNGLLGFSSPSTIPGLDKLKSQTQNSTEFGVDLRFFDERVTLDATYYSNKTSNQILALPLPQSTGYAFKVINAGDLTNKGVEITLGLVPVKTDFVWDMQFRFAANRNVVTLPPEIKQVTVASGYSGLTVKAENGQSIGLYGVKWLRDPNGNIVIDPATGLRKTITDQRLGATAPNFTTGLTNNFYYKGLALGFTLDYRKGGVVFSNTSASVRTNGLAEETLLNRGNIFIDKGVVQTGSTYIPNTVPVQSMQDYWSTNYQTGNTEANTFDASYVKLREARLSYTIPSKVFNSHAKFIKGLTVGLEGRNLWLIHSNVPHIDPEVNFFGSGSAGEGVEFNSVPSTRSIGFNVRLTL